MSNAQRINAPERITDAMRRIQEAADRLQLEAQALQFGARAALDVPDGWQWDGAGWAAPSAEEVEVAG